MRVSIEETPIIGVQIMPRIFTALDERNARARQEEIRRREFRAEGKRFTREMQQDIAYELKLHYRLSFNKKTIVERPIAPAIPQMVASKCDKARNKGDMEAAIEYYSDRIDRGVDLFKAAPAEGAKDFVPKGWNKKNRGLPPGFDINMLMEFLSNPVLRD